MEIISLFFENISPMLQSFLALPGPNAFLLESAHKASYSHFQSFSYRREKTICYFFSTILEFQSNLPKALIFSKALLKFNKRVCPRRGWIFSVKKRIFSQHPRKMEYIFWNLQNKNITSGYKSLKSSKYKHSELNLA